MKRSASILLIVFIACLSYAGITEAQTATPTGTWCHRFDWRTGTDGWVSIGADEATQRDGIGWQDLQPVLNAQIEIQNTYTQTTDFDIRYWKLLYNAKNVINDAAFKVLDGSTPLHISNGPLSEWESTPGDVVWAGDFYPVANSNHLNVSISTHGLWVYLRYLEVSGTGAPPWSNNCDDTYGTIGLNFGIIPSPTPIASATPVVFPTVALSANNQSIVSYLATSEANLRGLPSDLANPNGVPLLPSQTGSQVFGYAKWLLSAQTAEEIFGPFSPFIVTFATAVTLLLVIGIVYFLIFIAVKLIRFAVWIVTTILKFVPFFG